MALKRYTANGLNVSYLSNFFLKPEADAYLLQLKSLPFYTPTLKIWGKTVKPQRQMIAYGEPDVTYAFSGAEIPAKPWTPLMLELRNAVEKHVGCSFNYVLLNLYPNGQSYISQHKDNEASIDTTFPIAVLSFGEKRTLEFNKPNCEPTLIELEHGSLYTMEKPTNNLFTHGIAPDPDVKNPRISLTFRHIIPNSTFPLLKRPRLQIDENSQPSVQPSVSSQPTDPLDVNDWLMKYYQEPHNPVLAKWNLNWNTFAYIVLDKKLSLRLHIRTFNETSNGQLYPTKKGIILTSATFAELESKLKDFKFRSSRDSFISNNQLLTLFLDEDFCLMQQMFMSNSSSFYLKPEGLKLSKDQILNLIESLNNIGECLIEGLLCKLLPKLILAKNGKCEQHTNELQTKATFFTCVEKEIKLRICQFFICEGCNDGYNSAFDHECITKSYREKFISNKQTILLNLNPYNISEDLFSSLCCTCRLEAVLNELCIETYEKYFESMFLVKFD